MGNSAIWENQEAWLEEEKLKIEDLKRERIAQEQEKERSIKKESTERSVKYAQFKK